MGERRQGRVFARSGRDMAARGTSVILHLKADEDEFLKGWQLRVADPQVFRPRRVPDPHANEGRRTASPPTSGKPSTTLPRCGPSPRAEITRRGLPGLLQVARPRFQRSRWRGRHNRVEGSQSFTTLLYVPSQPPFDLMMGGARRAQGPEALHQARVHDGRGRGTAAELPALRARRGGCRRPAAQRQPRNAAAQPPARADQVRLRQARAGPDREAGEGRAGEVRHLLQGLRQHAQGRHRRGSATTASASPSCCASPPPRARAPTQDVSLDDYIGRMAVGPGRDLVHHRRQLRRRRRQPAAGSVQGQGHRSAADVRPHRRMDDRSA